MRAFVDRRGDPGAESDVGPGTLFSSGLIAGGSLGGILYAVLFGRSLIGDAEGAVGILPFLHEGPSGIAAGALLFTALAVILARVGSRRRTQARGNRA